MIYEITYWSKWMSVDVLLLACLLVTTTFVFAAGFLRKPIGMFGGSMIIVVSVAAAMILNQIWVANTAPGTDASVLQAGRMDSEYSDTIFDDTTSAVKQDPVTNRPIAINEDGYVSSDKCRSCHEEYYDSWHSSHHRTMTQVPTQDSVIADFENHTIQHSGRDFRFFHKDNEYFMEMKKTGQPELSKTFNIVLSTGAHHQQAFWCETEEGRSLGKIPFILDQC